MGKVLDEPSSKYWESSSGPNFNPDERFKSKLVISEAPHLRQQLFVTYTLTSTVNLPDAQVILGFPSTGLKLLSAYFPTEGEGRISDQGNGPHDIVWLGNLEHNQPISLKANFYISEIGRGNISGYLVLFIPEGNNVTRIVHTASIIAYLEVTKYTGRYEIYTSYSP